MKNDYILPILHKFLHNKCTEEELNILFQWVTTADTHGPFNEISYSLWEELSEKYEITDPAHKEKLHHEFQDIWKKINTQKQLIHKRKKYSHTRWTYQIAAIFLILITIGIGSVWIHQKTTGNVTIEEKIVARGEKENYLLPDGSEVTINAGSKLSIPSDFNKKERIIELNGEAYFDVVSQPDKPFIIRSNQADIQVLGTSFNVKSYEEDEIIGITVTTGKVLVKVEEMGFQLHITANEHLAINKQNGEIQRYIFQENNFTKWIKDELYFDKEPLSEVLNTISRKYDIEILLECSDCKHLIINGSLAHDNIETVTEAICFTTGLKSRFKDNTLVFY